jgi:type IV pilus assembly protein PilA
MASKTIVDCDGASPGPGQNGFTIIELMIVVAIVSILAVIAMPAYQNYTIRSKVSEAMIQMAEARTTVAEKYSASNIMPADNQSAGLDSPDTYDILDHLKRLEVTSTPVRGTIIVTLKIPGTSADNKQLQLVPSTTTGPVVWKCEPATAGGLGVSPNHIPPNCRG